MPSNKTHHLFLLFCLSVSIILVFFIFRPFLVPLIMAGVFAFLFQPLYTRLSAMTKGRTSLSAFLVTIATIIILIIPVGFLSTMILKEATDLYKDLASGNSGIVEQVETFFTNTKSEFPLLNNVDLNFSSYVSQGVGIVTKNIGAIFSSFFNIILLLSVFLIAFYYLLKDGDKFSKYIIQLSPLDDKDDRFIIKRLKSAVHATVRGNLIIGLIQGVLTGVGFLIFGVPNPVLWGGISVITSLIPGIGTALVIAPAVAYLFISGNSIGGIGLAIWGLTAIGLIDNILGPKLLGQGMKLHPLAVFISVIGGIAFFGPLGFILGPLALSICLALVDIYFSLKKKNIL